MMQPAPVSPLVDIAFTYFLDAQPDRVTQEDERIFRSAIETLISGAITKDECKAQLASLLNSGKAIDRIHDVLHVSECPRSTAESSPLSGKQKGQPWTTNEDNRLMCGVHRFGSKSWIDIAKFVGNGRTRAQCAQRWFRSLDPRLSKREWTPEEDQRLVSLAMIHGHRGWTHISQQMGNRSDVQCRYHYMQLMRQSHSGKSSPISPHSSTLGVPLAHLAVGRPIPNHFNKIMMKKGRPLQAPPLVTVRFGCPISARSQPMQMQNQPRPRNPEPDIFQISESESLDESSLLRLGDPIFDFLIDWSHEE
jgi:hypothetical protein